MEKYQSFHFSPLNNRSMLMPRIPKGTEYHVDSSRLVNPFEPIPEEVLKGRDPYSLLNSGFFKKEIELEGAKRPYGLYAPQNLWSKGACVVIFAESGVTAGEFITGIIVNKWLKLNVWDYSDQPFHLLGQICFAFIILFSGLCVIAIYLSAYFLHFICGEKKPHIHVL